MPADKEIEALGEAIAGTEKEIFGEAATGSDEIALDESGDRSPEAMGDGLEGQVETDDADEADDDADVKASDKDADADEGEDDADEGSEDDAGDDASDDDKTDKTPRDKDGKFAAKDGADKAGEGDKDAKAGRVPPGRLREETQKRQAAERERDELKARVEAGQREFGALSAKLDMALRQIDEVAKRGTAPKADDKPKAEAPDIFTNPAAFIAEMQKPLLERIDKLSQTREVDRAELSMRTARAEHKDVFDKAYEALGKLDPKDPEQFAIGARIARSADPGSALVDWFRKDQTLKEVGNDPAAYREKVAKETRDALMKDEEFRKSIIAELRGEAAGGTGRKGNNITRIPKSLNGASGGQSAQDNGPQDNSDRGIFEEVMAG